MQCPRTSEVSVIDVHECGPRNSWAEVRRAYQVVHRELLGQSTGLRLNNSVEHEPIAPAVASN
jgi:hypothetical protein